MLLLTNRDTGPIQGNTRPDHFVWPEIVRAVRKSEGLVFPSTDQVTSSVNSYILQLSIAIE